MNAEKKYRRWRELIPAALWPPPETVPEPENAALVWKAIDPEVAELNFFSSGFDQGDPALEDDAPFPTGEKGQSLSRWIEKKEPLLRQVETGLSRRGFENFDYRDSKVREPGLTLIRNTAFRALQLRAKRSWRDGNFAAAEKDLLLSLRFLRRFRKSNFSDFMVSCNFASRNFRTMSWMSGQPQAPPEFSRRLLKEIEEDRDQSVVREAFKVEFYHHFLETLAPLAESSRKPGAELALKEMFAAIDDSDAAAAALLASHLIEGHPHPFDTEETIQLRGGFMEQLLKRCEGPYQPGEIRIEISGALRGELQLWPEALSLADPDPDTVTAEALAEAKLQLRQVSNPLGKMAAASGFVNKDRGLFSMITLDLVPKAWYSFRVELELARAVLAIRLYARGEGTMPPDLEALAQKNYLPEKPIDPYTGKPLGYSAERGLVWSADADGVDHGGREPVYTGDGEPKGDCDRVWVARWPAPAAAEKK